jgi:hypothetical protein
MTGRLLAPCDRRPDSAAGPTAHTVAGAQVSSLERSASVPLVERWGVFELRLRGPSGGNPFVEVRLAARFEHEGHLVQVDGFYDGEGEYRVRFMPAALGRWRYRTACSVPALDGVEGWFECVEPRPGNHGPVRVHNTFHFQYADGTSFYPIGTTCYAWIHQDRALEERTLTTLANSPFNKVRMFIFPKHYVYNEEEPVDHPFVRDRAGVVCPGRFEPRFFRHLEHRVGQLRDLGIEADLILFHPYDRWGYSQMTAEQDHAYLRYVVARLASFRNVWWCVANEYDFLLDVKPMRRWHRFFEIVGEADPYGHLASIHNGLKPYDYTRSGVTHASLQHWDVARAPEWRNAYQKPVINDEPQYEGDIPYAWGSLSGQELVHRFWVMAASGCYASHGETYLNARHELWWSKGGELCGESWRRIGFLRQILEEAPPGGLTPLPRWSEFPHVVAAHADGYWLFYFGKQQPRLWWAGFPQDQGDYAIDLIDTWAMQITPLSKRPAPPSPLLPGEAPQAAPAFAVELPGRPHLAVRIRRL